MHRTSLGPCMRSSIMWSTEPDALWHNGPVLTATDGSKAVELHSLRRKQRGRGPGLLVRVLPRHTQPQDADSIDLTYSVEELDQGVVLLPLRSDFRPPAGAV